MNNETQSPLLLLQTKTEIKIIHLSNKCLTTKQIL